MKKIIFLALTVILLSSCKKDSKPPTPPVPTIVGKWNYTKERTQVLSASGSVISDETVTTFTADDYVQYNADSTGVASTAGGGLVDFTYNIAGTTDTEYQTPVTFDETPYVFTFTLTSTTLTRHSETLSNSKTTVIDDDFTK